MHSRFLISALAIVIAAGSFAQGTKDPKQALQEVQSFAETLSKQTTPMDRAAMQKAIQAKAREEIANIDITKVDPKDAFAWAQVFSLAGEDKSTCDLTHAFLKSNPSAKDRFDAQMLMMQSCNNLGEGKMLDATLRETKPTNGEDSMNLSESAIYEFADTIESAEGPTKTAEVLKQVELNVPATPATASPQGKAEGTYVHMMFKAEEAQMLAYAGKRDEGLKLLDDFAATLPKDTPLKREFDTDRARVAVIGTAGPELKADRVIGDFKSLGALKGKVVILDYFAHWCGPCRASFPDEAKMYTDLKDKGLQIIGVTQFYKFYGADRRKERDMTPDVEFGHMGEFAKKYNLTWPIIFNDGTDSTEYGVGPIPQVVLIDKKGVVRDVEIGYVPANFPRFRARVEELLKE